MVYVNYGTGIGCGIMMNGELIARDSLVTGELGHTTVDPSAHSATVGIRGVWRLWFPFQPAYAVQVHQPQL